MAYENVAQVQDYVSKNKVTYPVWLGNEQTLQDWNVSQLPTLYFLNEQGQRNGSVVGHTTTAGLAARLLF